MIMVKWDKLFLKQKTIKELSLIQV
jgi:hypothetical protein